MVAAEMGMKARGKTIPSLKPDSALHAWGPALIVVVTSRVGVEKVTELVLARATTTRL
jgi:hypothetical protein